MLKRLNRFADDLPLRIAYPDGSEAAFAYYANHNQTVMTDTLGVYPP